MLFEGINALEISGFSGEQHCFTRIMGRWGLLEAAFFKTKEIKRGTSESQSLPSQFSPRQMFSPTLKMPRLGYSYTKPPGTLGLGLWSPPWICGSLKTRLGRFKGISKVPEDFHP